LTKHQVRAVHHAAAWFEEELPCIYGVSARPLAMLKPN